MRMLAKPAKSNLSVVAVAAVVAVAGGFAACGAVSASAQESGHDASVHDASAHSADVERTPSPEGASVYIISPADGATVQSPVLVQFGLSGMGVAPAGVEWENTGHHHLIVDADTPAFDQYLPADEHHIHFGGGQTEVSLELEPGEHSLQLVLADDSHLPHEPPVVSTKITITVE